MKDCVYQGHVRSLVDLKTSIQRRVARIPRELLRATIHHAILLMQHLVEASGVHIENILYRADNKVNITPYHLLYRAFYD